MALLFLGCLKISSKLNIFYIFVVIDPIFFLQALFYMCFPFLGRGRTDPLASSYLKGVYKKNSVKLNIFYILVVFYKHLFLCAFHFWRGGRPPPPPYFLGCYINIFSLKLNILYIFVAIYLFLGAKLLYKSLCPSVCF